MNIGVFDSGLGGLSILKQFLLILPKYNYIYLADNAHVPYGNKSPGLIYEYTEKAVEFLFKKECQLIILACNSATANALRPLQQKYLPHAYPRRRILGVIRPVVEVAAGTGKKRIGIIGTKATIETASFVTEIHKINPQAQVYQQACPLLVPIIEEGELEWEGLELILNKYLRPLLAKNINELILACTHYELIVDKVKALAGERINVIIEGEVTAKKLADYLQRHPEIESKLKKESKLELLVTDKAECYLKQVKLFLGDGNNLEVKQAHLEQI